MAGPRRSPRLLYCYIWHALEVTGSSPREGVRRNAPPEDLGIPQGEWGNAKDKGSHLANHLHYTISLHRPCFTNVDHMLRRF